MASEEVEAFARAVSLVFGWIYFLAWTLSFYPQIISNWRRKSTVGLAVDFSVANIVGMSSYATYTGAMAFSPLIRKEYAIRHGGDRDPLVRANDFFYGLHGFLIVLVGYTQYWPRIWGLTVGRNQRLSPMMKCICCGCIAFVIASIALVLINEKGVNPGPADWMWLDVIYALGYVKLFMTVVKYTPQVYLNYKRKTTSGLRIEGILLDLLGGILSLGQLFIDASLARDWSSVTENPAKFVLANISLVYNMVYIVQHYIVYRDNRKRRITAEQAREDSPLLGGTQDYAVSYT